MDQKTTSHISIEAKNRNAPIYFEARRKNDRSRRKPAKYTKHQDGDRYEKEWRDSEVHNNTELEDLYTKGNCNRNADVQHDAQYPGSHYYADNELEYGQNNDYYTHNNYANNDGHYDDDFEFGYNDSEFGYDDVNNTMDNHDDYTNVNDVGYGAQDYEVNDRMGYDKSNINTDENFAIEAENYEVNNTMDNHDDYTNANYVGYGAQDYEVNDRMGYDKSNINTDENFAIEAENYEVNNTMDYQDDYTNANDIGYGAQDYEVNDRMGYDKSNINTDENLSFDAENYERNKGMGQDDERIDIDDNVSDGDQGNDEGPEDHAYQIEDDDEVLLPQRDSKSESKKKVPCLWCPEGPCRYIGKNIYYFFTGPPDDYAPIKTILGFPFGFVIAYGLYYALIEPLTVFSKDTRQMVGLGMVLGISCGYALSVQVRCLVCLVIPTFFGKTGRSYIGTFAVAFIIAGPVHNMMLNYKEITRSLSCSAELSANHTRAKWELKMKPLEDAMREYQREGLFMKKVVRKINKEFIPMKREVKDNGQDEFLMAQTRAVDTLSGRRRGNRAGRISRRNKYSGKDRRQRQVEKRYRKKLDLQCENVWNEGVLRCRRKFQDLYTRCLSAIPFIGYLLCLPFKMTFFCELIRLIPGAIGMECNSLDVLEPGFGETYVAAEDMMNTMEENFEINLQYKIIKYEESLDWTTAQEIRKGTMHEFERKQKWMQWCMDILSRLLAFTFLRILFSVYSYNKKYLADFSYDNVYITSYFEHIDDRRKRQGKNGLLPLKKSESCGLVYPWSPKIVKKERKKLIKGTFMLLMRAFVSYIIIHADYLLYTVLDIIRRHSRVDYQQFGKHHVKVKVFGTGFLSNIVRMFIRSFDSKHTLDKVTTNYGCLPQPITLPRKYIIYIYSLYFTVWFLMIVESYGLRLRRLIASFFYRKREGQSTVPFQRPVQKEKKLYASHSPPGQTTNEKEKSIGLLTSFRKEFPAWCGWLKVFQSGRDTCIICDEPQDDTFIECDTPDCPFGYCFDCWRDVRFKCYACTGEDSDDSDLSEDESDTSGDEEF